LASAANQLNDSKDLVKNRAMPALMGLFLIAGLAGLGIGLIRGKTSQRVPYFAMAACSLLVFGFLAVMELALSNGTTFTLGGNETGLAHDNTGSGGMRGLSPKDQMALFSLDDEPMKKDKQNMVQAPKPATGPKILSVRPKQGSPIQSPRDVAKSTQMDKQTADTDKARVPEEPLGQEKPVASRGRIFAGIPLLPPPPPPLAVREYAHVHARGENQGRGDFAETLFWQPVLVLPDGNGEVSFELCDSVTSFQVRAVGHTLDGRLAEVAIELISRKP
jgi:hypothetical protein